MARFSIPKYGENKSALRVQNEGSLVAYFNFVDGETGLEYRDFKLIQGKNGFFVASPSGKSYTDKAGKTQYPEYVRAAYDAQTESKRTEKGKAWFAELSEVAVAEYEKQTGSAPTPTKKRSGAGPLPAKAATVVNNDDLELPF